MENNFYNPFDLSTCEYSKQYYHWCFIKDDKTIVQVKNLLSIDDVKKDISDKRPVFDSIKVIRTIEPFEDMLRFFRCKYSDVIIPDLFSDDEYLFDIDDNCKVDVTNKYYTRDN